VCSLASNVESGHRGADKELDQSWDDLLAAFVLPGLGKRLRSHAYLEGMLQQVRSTGLRACVATMSALPSRHRGHCWPGGA
jgi:hypothetical protein